MKKVILLVLFPIFISSENSPFVELPPQHIIEQPIVIAPKPIDNLISALIHVESRGIDSAIGDKHLGEPSIGVLQIRPIMVREVNRICKKLGLKQRFTLKDRFDRQKSIHMFTIWKGYHHKDDNFEAIARSWNGGPRWRKIKRTEKYWDKVEKQLNN
tara:strand:- start:89 stop:559 length:471 start_codon:yes stop_codon:yes gene_type:complete